MHDSPKIPTFIGLVLLAVIIGSSIFVVELITRDRSTASTTAAPQDVEITNISDTSLIVSWITNQEANGMIMLTPTKGKQVSVFDERDQEGSQGKYLTHHVAARGLEPDTSYEIVILSNGKQFRNGTNPWVAKTFVSLSANPGKLEPAYGTIVKTDGSPAGGALVYVTLEGAQPLSALANASGSWLVPLTLARNVNGSAYIPPGERLNEHIATRLGNESAAAVTDTLNDSPVPEITLGKTYDFRKQQGQKPASGASLGELISRTQPVLGVQTATTSAGREATITSPLEGSSLSTLLPLIQGTGIPGKKVAVELSTPKQTGETVAGDDGIWRYTPKTNLAPGRQVLTVITQDKEGSGVTLMRNFAIFKSGTQVLGEATPSGTLFPTPTPRSFISPMPFPDLSPTPTLTPLPISGNSSYTMFFAVLGMLFILTGSAILFK